MENVWWIAALISSLFTAVYIYSSQIFKMPASLFMVYRGLGGGLVMLPFIPFFTVIHDPYFYVFVIAQGLWAAYLDNRFFHAVNKYGAEMTSAIQPLSIGVTFVFWLMIYPYQIILLIHNPWRCLGIIACLVGITVTILQLRKSKIGFRAFIYLLPCLFMTTGSDILNKQALFIGKENLASAVFYYILIMSIIMGVANLWAYLRTYKTSLLWKPQNLKNGVILIIWAFLSLGSKNVAMAKTFNPSYVAAIIYTYPMLIIGWDIYIAWRHKKFLCPRISLKIVGILFASVIGLILLGK